jgi:hypothetical protein
LAIKIVLTDEERAELTGLVRFKLTSVRLARRAQIVLLAADGLQNKDIALRLAVGRLQVSRWRDRYHRCQVSERGATRGCAGDHRSAPRAHNLEASRVSC